MKNFHSLKSALDRLAEQYGHSYLDTDPVGIVHRYDSAADIEIAGMIASCLAYGGAGQIRKSVGAALGAAGNAPADFARSLTMSRALSVFRNFKHRWTTGGEIAYLFYTLGGILNEYGAIGEFVRTVYDPGAESVEHAMTGFSMRIRDGFTGDFTQNSDRTGISYLVPSPADGSACKRLALYFRWMVRGPDAIDFGLWDFIRPSQLVIPVDRHIARMSNLLDLTARKSPGWRMALEITEALKRFDPEDPLRYDFALVRPGILGDCGTEDGRGCRVCELNKVCNVNK